MAMSKIGLRNALDKASFKPMGVQFKYNKKPNRGTVTVFTSRKLDKSLLLLEKDDGQYGLFTMIKGEQEFLETLQGEKDGRTHDGDNRTTSVGTTG